MADFKRYNLGPLLYWIELQLLLRTGMTGLSPLSIIPDYVLHFAFPEDRMSLGFLNWSMASCPGFSVHDRQLADGRHSSLGKVCFSGLLNFILSNIPVVAILSHLNNVIRVEAS